MSSFSSSSSLVFCVDRFLLIAAAVSLMMKYPQHALFSNDLHSALARTNWQSTDEGDVNTEAAADGNDQDGEDANDEGPASRRFAPTQLQEVVVTFALVADILQLPQPSSVPTPQQSERDPSILLTNAGQESGQSLATPCTTTAAAAVAITPGTAENCTLLATCKPSTMFNSNKLVATITITT